MSFQGATMQDKLDLLVHYNSNQNIENEPEKIDGVVVLLHGLGATNSNLLPAIEQLHLDVSLKWILPNAPIRAITVNNNERMRAWYDILDFDDLQRVIDIPGMYTSIDYIEVILDDLVAAGYNASKIILAGFSQGGAMTYYAGIGSKHNLAGLLIMSGYLPGIQLLPQAPNISAEKLNMPIMICHGTDDMVVRIDYAKHAINYLSAMNFNYQWHSYDTQHNICTAELLDISKWLNTLFSLK
jgi:phospholipase/carboxylesterase